MSAASPKPTTKSFDADRAWQLLGGIFDFGDRLDFVFLEPSSPEVLGAWRAALRAHCRGKGQPWSEAKPGQSILDWLEGERVRGLALEQAKQPREREVYFGFIPKDEDEHFVFSRINENRDNLVRTLNGVLCLAGYGDFVRRIAYGSPSIWAMRTSSFELDGPPPPSVRAPEDEGESGFESARVEERFDLDVFVSASPRDERQARTLVQGISDEGLSVKLGVEEADYADVGHARRILVLLSASYAYSTAWERLRNSRFAREEPEKLGRRLVIANLDSGGVTPGMLQAARRFDLSTEDARATSYANLLRVLRGEEEERPAPFLEPASAALRPWIDEVPFPWSNPSARALRDALVAAYDSVDQARYLALKGGLSLGRVSFHGAIEPVWNNILEVAATQGILRKLIEVVLQDPNVRAYHRRIRQLTGLAPPNERP